MIVDLGRGMIPSSKGRVQMQGQSHNSFHARVRGQQRGIKQSARAVSWEHADIEEPAGEGTYRLSVSRRQMEALVASGIIAASQADRCQRLTLVVNGWNVITNYRKPRVH